MTQSRRMSLCESLLNVDIGYGIAILTQIIVFPWFGIHIYAAENAEIGSVFTVVSLVRSYTLRRGFNWWHNRGMKRGLIVETWPYRTISMTGETTGPPLFDRPVKEHIYGDAP